MAGGMGHRPLLAPAGHPAEDQLRVPFLTHLRTNAETLADARTEALYQRIGTFDQLQYSFDAVGVFEVDGE